MSSQLSFFLGNSLDTLNHVQGSLASDGRTYNVIAIISQNASLRCDSTPLFLCKDDLIQNTDSIISFLNSSLDKDTIANSTVLGFLEKSLSNRGSVESRSESGCRRLVEASMGISIANRLHTPFIGVLDSDLSSQFEEFEGIFSTTAYPLSGDQHPVHLRGYTLVSNLSFFFEI